MHLYHCLSVVFVYVLGFPVSSCKVRECATVLVIPQSFVGLAIFSLSLVTFLLTHMHHLILWMTYNTLSYCYRYFITREWDRKACSVHRNLLSTSEYQIILFEVPLVELKIVSYLTSPIINEYIFGSITHTYVFQFCMHFKDLSAQR